LGFGDNLIGQHGIAIEWLVVGEIHNSMVAKLVESLRQFHAQGNQHVRKNLDGRSVNLNVRHLAENHRPILMLRGIVQQFFGKKPK